jgi:2-polyprenyl-3-methyl-5-hydroxy-6-metoxy-1,4-benzoquinol methylase
MIEAWNRYWDRAQPARVERMSQSKRRIMDVLGRYLKKPGMRVLDAGCGSGWFTKTFCDLGMRTTALDNSPSALRLAQTLSAGRAACLRDDLLDPALPSRITERFDLIMTDGLFEHFSAHDQRRIMGNLRALCAPGGHIATFVPNLLSPWQLIRPFMMPGIHEKPFVLPQLLALNSGMKVIERGGLNVLPLRVSPEWAAPALGMILYTVSQPGEP